MRSTLSKLLRYGVTGGIAAIVDAGGFALLLAAGLAVAAAGTLSFCIAALVNYGLSSRFVFARSATPQGFVLFFVAALIGLSVNLGVTLAGVYLAGLVPIVAKIVGIGTAFLVNFALNLLIVFRPPAAAAKRPGMPE
ncbi:MAG TPA: GtrA family protein [Reyranella sp.]|nr:GtrA family protein [Reyranella sp.]